MSLCRVSASGTVWAKAVSLVQNLVFNQNRYVNLIAGNDCGWAFIISDTRVVGYVEISAGGLTIESGGLSVR